MLIILFLRHNHTKLASTKSLKGYIFMLTVMYFCNTI